MTEDEAYKVHIQYTFNAFWMAVPSDTDVYLEAVETAKDTQTEADRIRAAGVGGLRRSIQPKSLLENGGKRSRAKSTNERKTDKLGLL